MNSCLFRALVLFKVGLLLTNPAQGVWKGRINSELGLRASSLFADETRSESVPVNENFAYLALKLSWQTARKDREYRWQLEGWAGARAAAEGDLREASWQRRSPDWNLKLGFQQLSWGQSFAFFVADLTNPKDFRDPFVQDALWRNRSQLMLTTDWLFSSGAIQLFLAPLPRRNFYPNENSPYGSELPLDNLPAQQALVGDRAAEYGLRINHLFGFGLDLNLYGLRHWHRNPLLIPTLTTGVPSLREPDTEQITSFGFGFSQDLGGLVAGTVLRGDVMSHNEQPFVDRDFVSVTTRSTTDFVIGAEWTSESELSLAAQWISQGARDEDQTAYSAKLSLPLFARLFELSALHFQGLTVSESWTQISTRVNFSEHWSADLTGDFVSANSKTTDPATALSALKDRDRWLAWLRWTL